MPESLDAAPTGPCEISRACGGCALIDQPYEVQLDRKTEQVRTALRAHAELDALADTVVGRCLAAEDRLAYRNRAKLAVLQIEGETRIGLYRRATNVVVDLAECAVTSTVLRRAIASLRRWLDVHRLARPAGPVFYVDLRESVGARWHLTLVVDDARFDPAALPLDDLCVACPELVGVAANFGDSASSYPMGSVTRVIRGPDTIEMTLPVEGGDEVTVGVPVGGFFQVRASVLPSIHARMRAHLGSDGPLYDLYCGVGVHGLMIERRSTDPDRCVVGIEESSAAVAAARANAARLGVCARYVAGRVEERLAEELARRAATRFVLNPARAGCRPEVLDAIAATPGARVAYLSCNPQTLARDLAQMARRRFHASAVQPVDLMPQTDQVETLALID
jgi:23S rRNA (uracil1939-C5)-methyltransferase